VLKKTKVWIVVAAVVGLVLIGVGFAVFVAPKGLGADAAVVKSDPQANVPVSVTLSSDGRRLAIEIDWDDELHKAEGTDRFTARVMAGTQEIKHMQGTESRPDVDAFEMAFDEAEATLLLAAAQTGDAVVAITQQADADGDTLHETNHATVLRIPSPKADAAGADAPLPPKLNVVLVGNYRAAASTTPPTVDCSSTNIGPGSDLSGCDFYGANLGLAHLAGANLTGANLAGANLALADLTGANLAGATLTNATLAEAYLTGADLTGADLTGANLGLANLTNANLTNANLTGADLGLANLTGANLTGAIMPDPNQPDPNQPDQNMPDPGVPDPFVPDPNVSDLGVPDPRFSDGSVGRVPDPIETLPPPPANFFDW
jgi:uncharacterized protein YjbI with pentapeptide repeats